MDIYEYEVQVMTNILTTNVRIFYLPQKVDILQNQDMINTYFPIIS